MTEYQPHRTGFFSQFPFGTFAFAHLDDRVLDSETYLKATHAQQEANGRDTIHLLPTQPHVEIWNTEYYRLHSYAEAQSNENMLSQCSSRSSLRSRGAPSLSTTKIQRRTP